MNIDKELETITKGLKQIFAFHTGHSLESDDHSKVDARIRELLTEVIDKSLQAEWYRNVIAVEMGYDGPAGNGVCPLQDWLHEAKRADIVKDDRKRLDWLDRLRRRKQFMNSRAGEVSVSSDMHFQHGTVSIYIRDMYGDAKVVGAGDDIRTAIDNAQSSVPKA